MRRRGFTFGCSGDKTCFVLRRAARWGGGGGGGGGGVWLTGHGGLAAWGT